MLTLVKKRREERGGEGRRGEGRRGEGRKGEGRGEEKRFSENVHRNVEISVYILNH